MNPMGVPVDLPSKIPDKNSTESSSFLWVTISDCPGLLLFNSELIKSRSIFTPAGHPSMTPPRAFPWDSPKDEILKIIPSEFPARAWIIKMVP